MPVAPPYENSSVAGCDSIRSTLETEIGGLIIVKNEQANKQKTQQNENDAE